jgi:serine/threonine-protein phosphatase 5
VALGQLDLAVKEFK